MGDWSAPVSFPEERRKGGKTLASAPARPSSSRAEGGCLGQNQWVSQQQGRRGGCLLFVNCHGLICVPATADALETLSPISPPPIPHPWELSPHFTDERTEAQRSKLTAQGHTDSNWLSKLFAEWVLPP